MQALGSAGHIPGAHGQPRYLPRQMAISGGLETPERSKIETTPTEVSSMAKRTLTEAEIEESTQFGNAALAAAGHVAKPEAQADARRALRGGITFDEAVRRAAARAKQ